MHLVLGFIVVYGSETPPKPTWKCWKTQFTPIRREKANYPLWWRLLATLVALTAGEAFDLQEYTVPPGRLRENFDLTYSSYSVLQKPEKHTRYAKKSEGQSLRFLTL